MGYSILHLLDRGPFPLCSLRVTRLTKIEVHPALSVLGTQISQVWRCLDSNVFVLS